MKIVHERLIFMKFCKDFTIFASGAKYRSLQFLLENIVQKLDHPACNAIQGFGLWRDVVIKKIYYMSNGLTFELFLMNILQDLAGDLNIVLAVADPA